MQLELQQKTEFLVDLAKQDDWSFVIKAHALLETAVTQMIVDSLGEKRLQKFVRRLPLSGATGKLSIAEQLELLDVESIKCIRLFSDLRNSLVHNFENLTFSFDKHFQSLDKTGKEKWKGSLSWFVENKREAIERWGSFVETCPKPALLCAILFVVQHCLGQSTKARGKKELRELTDRASSELSDVLKNAIETLQTLDKSRKTSP